MHYISFVFLLIHFHRNFEFVELKEYDLKNIIKIDTDDWYADNKSTKENACCIYVIKKRKPIKNIQSNVM